MERKIAIPEDLYARLEALARPFEDREPADVIRRLIDSQASNQNSSSSFPPSPSSLASTRDAPASQVNGRVPRERGATVKLNGHVLHADSVRDLYEQTLHYLSSNAAWDRVVQLAPIKTSSRRYLISKDPTHPNGNPFVIPVHHRGLYMEAHKNYQTAISQLSRLLAKCGIEFTYIGV
jgi:hypothetical protein